MNFKSESAMSGDGFKCPRLIVSESPGGSDEKETKSAKKDSERGLLNNVEELSRIEYGFGRDHQPYNPGNLIGLWRNEFGFTRDGHQVSVCFKTLSKNFHFQARPLVGPGRGRPGDTTSFTFELNPDGCGVRAFPFPRPKSPIEFLELCGLARARFEKAKEEVDYDLFCFLIEQRDISQKMIDEGANPLEVKENTYLFFFADKFRSAPQAEFWMQCENIVYELYECREKFSRGIVKKRYSLLILILTRCTRFCKEHRWLWDRMPLVPLAFR